MYKIKICELPVKFTSFSLLYMCSRIGEL